VRGQGQRIGELALGQGQCTAAVRPVGRPEERVQQHVRGLLQVLGQLGKCWLVPGVAD